MIPEKTTFNQDNIIKGQRQPPFVIQDGMEDAFKLMETLEGKWIKAEFEEQLKEEARLNALIAKNLKPVKIKEKI